MSLVYLRTKVKSLHHKPKPAGMDSYCIKLTHKRKKAWKRYFHSPSWDDYYREEERFLFIDIL